MRERELVKERGLPHSKVVCGQLKSLVLLGVSFQGYKELAYGVFLRHRDIETKLG